MKYFTNFICKYLLLFAFSLFAISLTGCAGNLKDFSKMNNSEFQKAAFCPERSDSVVKMLYMQVKPEIQTWLTEKKFAATRHNATDKLRLCLYPSGYIHFDKYFSFDKIEENKEFTSAHIPPILSTQINSVIKLYFIKSDSSVSINDSLVIYYEENAPRSKQSIQNTVMKNMANLRRLYNSYLRTRPDFRGKITTKFAIDEFGKVIYYKTLSSSMDSESFDKKIEENIKKWEFPVLHREGDVTEVTYPFVFSP